MRGWRKLRLGGLHLVTWIALASGIAVAGAAQVCEGVSENYWGYSGLGWPLRWTAEVRPGKCQWLAAAVNLVV